VGEFRPGEVIGGRYEIIELIGSGGMANVYRAHDPHLGRDVAVKVLADRYTADPAFVERFRREASAAAQLNHPNIVQVFDRGETDGTYFIVMEYLNGPDLKTVIRERGALPPLEAIDNTQQILGALAAAHRHDVIHRDIKPQNVMLASDGLLKVTDFGIARAGAESEMTEAGSVIGTAQYLSPEQAHGGELTSASDCYSAGIVLYEMLTGRVPFDGERPVVVAMKQINEPPVPPSIYAPGIPHALERIVLKALAKRPSERYRTAEEFSAALSEVRRQIDPESTGQHTMVFGALAGGGGATSVMAASSPPPAEPTVTSPAVAAGTAPPPRKRRNRTTAIVIGIIAVLGIIAIAAILLVSHLGGSNSSVTIPTVKGEPVSTAKTSLTALGFKVVTATVTSSEALKGLAVGTNPAEGQSVAKDSTVTLQVGAGPKTVTVPNVVGLSQQAATSALQKTGLVPAVVFSPSATIASDDVISQSPAANTVLAPQQSVTITVSQGAAVPSVVGKSQSTASQLLSTAGLTIGTVTTQTSATVASGLVISQSPTAGTQVPAGTSVNLVESSGPALLTVPSVVTLASSTASSNLKAAGFSPDALFANNAAPAGSVFAQSPAAGTQLAQGSTVHFTVSLGPKSTTNTTSSTGTTPAPPPTTTGERPHTDPGRA